jgi:hypothetical protein
MRQHPLTLRQFEKQTAQHIREQCPDASAGEVRDTLQFYVKDIWLASVFAYADSGNVFTRTWLRAIEQTYPSLIVDVCRWVRPHSPLPKGYVLPEYRKQGDDR